MTNRPSRRPRCNLVAAGHSTRRSVQDRPDRHLSWVQGTVDLLDENVLDAVPGAQPLRFVPDLSLPHGTDDPLGIPIELYHHDSVRIRNLLARGFSSIWYPDDECLVVGHRSFHMSLLPVPQCEEVETPRGAGHISRDELRRAFTEMSVLAYSEAFAKWQAGDSLDAHHNPVFLLRALQDAWSQPSFEQSLEHELFREVLLDAFRSTTTRDPR